MTFTPAERIADVPPSGIRRFFKIAEERDDVISLGVGEPDFSTPWSARDAAIRSLELGRTSYTSNRGIRELRQLISDYVERYSLRYDPSDEILVTTGASEAVDLACRAFIDPGDTVAVVQPGYISYGPCSRFNGGSLLPVPTTEDDAFRLTRDSLEAAGAEEADILIYCYPNNPTGAIMERSELAEVAAFAREHDLLVFADEIYAELTYDGEHTSIASLPGMRDRTIVFNGFSKSFAMTGLRLGYALGPADAIDSLNRVHQYTMLSAPTTAQHAAIEALRSCEDDVEAMVAEYDRRRRFVLSRLEEIGMRCFEAKGAFYVFPRVPDGTDGQTFAERLLREHGVAVVPGDVFGETGSGHLRVSYATSLDELRRAFRRIESFVQDR